MKIGDEVYIHGYVNEIRKDLVIIENAGGYFGTVLEEIIKMEKSKDYCVGDRVRHKELDACGKVTKVSDHVISVLFDDGYAITYFDHVLELVERG